jgi:hypothetical protein
MRYVMAETNATAPRVEATDTTTIETTETVGGEVGDGNPAS